MTTYLKAALLALALTATTAMCAPTDSDGLVIAKPFTWNSDIEAVTEEARINQKPMLVFVYRDKCSACASIAKRIAQNHFLQGQIRRFAFVALDVDTAAQQGFTAARTPTFFFVDPEGNDIVPPLQGEPKDDYEFVDYLTMVEIAYKKGKEGK